MCTDKISGKLPELRTKKDIAKVHNLLREGKAIQNEASSL